jgi:hypothetical protein
MAAPRLRDSSATQMRTAGPDQSSRRWAKRFCTAGLKSESTWSRTRFSVPATRGELLSSADQGHPKHPPMPRRDGTWTCSSVARPSESTVGVGADR